MYSLISHSFKSDSTPCIKLLSKSFGSSEKTGMEYLRLSLPLTFHSEFTAKSVIRERQKNALSLYRSQMEEDNENQQIFNFDQPDANKQLSEASQSALGSSAATVERSSVGKPLSSLFSKITSGGKQSRQLAAASKAASTHHRGTTMSKASAAAAAASAAVVEKASKFARSSEFGIKTTPAQQQAQQALQQQQQAAAAAAAVAAAAAAAVTLSLRQDIDAGIESNAAFLLESADETELRAIVEHVDEYYYGVRIFPGQDLSKVRLTLTNINNNILLINFFPFFFE